ncbi:MAG: adenylate/guanylate cyclase domain-containing protein [Armatimonadetes bacterium]|nr:adenylate/guanylate cyclase domain-containing protein [Armatimonadota bacterium]
MSQLDDATVNVETSSDEREFIRTGFDLVLLHSDGTEGRFPICHSQITLGSPGPRDNDIILDAPDLANRQVVLTYRQGQLFFTNAAPSLPVTVNGEVSSFRQLHDGDEVQVGEFRIRVAGLMDQMATLEGYTDPYRQKQWSIGSEPVQIGRPGKRVNHVELEDRTVSREQATIRYVERTFFLEPETSNSPIRVNGEAITQPRVLTDGDLLQFGQQLLRFRTTQGYSKPRALLPQEATILFSDIWNYSSLAEKRPLEETVMQMNEFYRAMGKVIEAHGGILMTFLGDAMMAVFGADQIDINDPAQAVEAALDMQRRLIQLNEEWKRRGKPTMRVGVGINTGEVMLGHVGFTGKHEFAAMGDNTNLAARLEKLTREYDAGVIISGSTEAAVRGRFETRSLGQTRVKGRQAPVDLHEVLGKA